MPSDYISEINKMAELFRALNDATRIKILVQLLQEEICVTDISRNLGITESSISHHLQVLKMNHLVQRKKKGKFVFYQVTDEYIKQILELALDHIQG